MELGVAGEFRCVVRHADGTVKTDTGFQKNLILNQGLDFFGGGRGSSIGMSCVVGSGNSSPVVTQTQLDAVIAISNGMGATSDYSYTDKGDGLYRMWVQTQYIFTGLNSVNISEVGLVSQGSISSYYLTTRALIKDSFGNSASITVLTGESLDIYYKIHKVVSTIDEVTTVSMLDGSGGSVPYNLKLRPSYVGGSAWASVDSPVLEPASGRYDYSTQDLYIMTAYPSGGTEVEGSFKLSAYTPSSYKIVATVNFGLNSANVSIRKIQPNTSWFYFYPFQLRFGSVANDSPINKTNKKTLSIPIEISWGRYEGEL